MRGTKAKRLRKQVFGMVAGGLLKRTFYRINRATGVIRCGGAREYYQGMKKAF